jgi:hypothetical protein
MLENLGQVLPVAARRYGAKTALVCGGRKFGFEELSDLSGRAANGLRGLGVRPGDRVTLYSQNRWEWIVGYYAISRLGAVINPINVMLTPEEVAFVVGDCVLRSSWPRRRRGGRCSRSGEARRSRRSSSSGTTRPRGRGPSTSCWSGTSPSSRAPTWRQMTSPR